MIGKAKSAANGLAPALTLMVLAPVIAEVLSGATRLSYILALIPEILVWGGGALLIRELVRRWGGGWWSVVLLGIGLAVAEECIIQQTSLAPLPWLGNAPAYGRYWGVNWLYFLYMLGYECVWVVLVPIQLTDLIFPEQRQKKWLGLRGMIVVSVLFLLGSFVAWFSWTQLARPNVFHVPKYTPPLPMVALAVVAIVLLALTAYAVRTMHTNPADPSRRSPSPWLIGLGILPLALVWYGLIVLVFAPQPNLPVWIPMVVGVAWAIFAFLVVSRWSGAQDWWDIHRWGLVSSAILVSMAAGFLEAARGRTWT